MTSSLSPPVPEGETGEITHNSTVLAGFVRFNHANINNITSFVKASQSPAGGCRYLKLVIRSQLLNQTHLTGVWYTCVCPTFTVVIATLYGLYYTNMLAPPPELVQPIAATAAGGLGYVTVRCVRRRRSNNQSLHGSTGSASETSLSVVPSFWDSRQSLQLIHNNPNQSDQNQQWTSKSLVCCLYWAREDEWTFILGQGE